ncbi:hypothetical protein [Endozoicomonas ascidiicola]|uniref:hypothetical protein n=1 Tax=Endozoicomonas ascidiicola TaxID=1698521 RepID=UPI000831D772|nr:hypothetical protein [Endozoicomonas ascidiicola]
MQAEMALAKLKVKTVRHDTGVGGIPDLTPEDIAAGLAGCKAVAYYLGLYKYSGDYSVLPELERHVFAHVGQIGHAEQRFNDVQYSAMARFLKKDADRFPLSDDDRAFCQTVLQLARLLVDEVVHENRHKTCGGTGIYQGRMCKGCGGTGRRLSGVSEQARRLNVTNHIYVMHWQPLFDRFVPMMHGFEKTVLSHLQRKLYDAKEAELCQALTTVR